MLFNDVLFNNALDKSKITSPSLCGGHMDNVLRIGDLQNAISVGTMGALGAANLIKEVEPYYREYDSNNNLIVIPSRHFLVGLRRQLAGDIDPTTSTFSPMEQQFYTEFQEWQMGAVKTGDLLIALEYLDDWLVDELAGNSHPKLNRNYDNTHKWNKIFKRGATI